jgi:phage repressor protein C with HTH and peptisase S24 domain
VKGWPANVDMGHGADDDGYAVAHKLKFRAESLNRQGLRPEQLGVFYGAGDSMEPTLYAGDALMFNMSEDKPMDGEIFVVQYDGGRLVKRLENIGGRWFMVSDNRDDPRWRKPVPTDDPRHDFKILGRVRWVARWIK